MDSMDMSMGAMIQTFGDCVTRDVSKLEQVREATAAGHHWRRGQTRWTLLSKNSEFSSSKSWTYLKIMFKPY